MLVLPGKAVQNRGEALLECAGDRGRLQHWGPSGAHSLLTGPSTPIELLVSGSRPL